MKAVLDREKKKQALIKHYGYDIVRARDFILARAQLGQGPLLEIGTGKGHFTLALAKKGFRFVSVDRDPQPQRVARAYLRRYGLAKRVRILMRDAEDLGFADSSFDMVISVNFMHHASRPIKCLQEMVRVARGKIAVADINKQGEAVLEKVHQKEGRHHQSSRISFEAMRAFFERKGFKVKTYRGYCQTILVATKGVLK